MFQKMSDQVGHEKSLKTYGSACQIIIELSETSLINQSSTKDIHD
jgi:hypothetical protein